MTTKNKSATTVRSKSRTMSVPQIEMPTRRSWPAAGIGGLMAFGRAALRIVLDTALPPLCASCRDPLGGAGGLCPACWSKVSFIAPPYCDRLGIPFPYDPGPGVLSMEAIADPPAYGRARAAVRFDDVARDLVHHLKYGDRLDLAATMGRWMARAGTRGHRRGRRAGAGAAALAAAVGAALQPGRRARPGGRGDEARPRPVLRGALKRVRATPQQVGLVAATSAPPTSRAPSWSPTTARRPSPAGASCWSTTC